MCVDGKCIDPVQHIDVGRLADTRYLSTFAVDGCAEDAQIGTAVVAGIDRAAFAV